MNLILSRSFLCGAPRFVTCLFLSSLVLLVVPPDTERGSTSTLRGTFEQSTALHANYGK